MKKVSLIALAACAFYASHAPAQTFDQNGNLARANASAKAYIEQHRYVEPARAVTTTCEADYMGRLVCVTR